MKPFRVTLVIKIVMYLSVFLIKLFVNCACPPQNVGHISITNMTGTETEIEPLNFSMNFSIANNDRQIGAASTVVVPMENKLKPLTDPEPNQLTTNFQSLTNFSWQTFSAVALPITTNLQTSANVLSAAASSLHATLFQSNATQLPINAPQSSTNSIQLPTIVTQLPAIPIELPNLANQLLATSTQLPVIATLLPTTETQLSGIATQLPEIASQLPEISNQLPGIVTQLPVIATQLPTIATQLLMITNELPAIATKLPAVATPSSTVAGTLNTIATRLPTISAPFPTPESPFPAIASQLPTTTNRLQTTATLLSSYNSTRSPGNCDLPLLVHCFMNALDEWSFYLASYKDNLESLNSTICVPYKNMAKCVNLHKCTRRIILNVSNAVADLLVHRNPNVSFLKSFFLLSYPCTIQGLEIVERSRDCFVKNRIGRKINNLLLSLEYEFRLRAKRFRSETKTKSETTVAKDEIAVDDDYGWYCNLLISKSTALYDFVAASNKCNLESAHLTCRAVTDAFVNIFPENLRNCSVSCSDQLPLQNSPEDYNFVTQSATTPNHYLDRSLFANEYEPLKLIILNIRQMTFVRKENITLPKK